MDILSAGITLLLTIDPLENIAVERLMGMVLLAISVQLQMDAVSTYLNLLIFR